MLEEAALNRRHRVFPKFEQVVTVGAGTPVYLTPGLSLDQHRLLVHDLLLRGDRMVLFSNFGPVAQPVCEFLEGGWVRILL